MVQADTDMLCCGRDWRPQTVRRVIETLPTSTAPVKVATDDGIGFLKGIGNPAGLDSLATELVCGELARWLGLITPDFSVINVADLRIDLARGGPLVSGPAFISREVDYLPFDGADLMLRKLKDISQVSQLIVFDTWIRNQDRYAPDPNSGMINRDNLFFKPNGRKVDLVAFDHSHCFVAGTLEDDLNGPGIIEDESVYGFFPEFSPFVRADAVGQVVDRLKEMNTAVASAIVDSIPVEWGLTTQLRSRWVDIICERAQRVAGYAPAMMIEQSRLEV